MPTNDDRTPPTRTRVTGLQEQQLVDLVKVGVACSAMYREAGFDAAEVPPRSEADFATLPRENSVRVIEADHVVAGFIAWHDESPGVGCIVDVQVHPDYQRFGLASKLVEEVHEEAKRLRLEQIVVRCWEKAPWAMSFLRHHRFIPIDASAPALVLAWKEERAHTGRPLTRPGEVALWSPIGPAPKVMTDEEMDMTLLSGEIPGDDD